MLIGGETESGWCVCEVRRPLLKAFAALAFTVLALTVLFELLLLVFVLVLMLVMVLASTT